MEEREHNIEDFERYLNGLLSVEETQAFEDKLSMDASLREEFNQFKDLSAFMGQMLNDQKTAREESELDKLQGEIHAILTQDQSAEENTQRQSAISSWIAKIRETISQLSRNQKLILGTAIVMVLLFLISRPDQSSCEPEKIYREMAAGLDQYHFSNELGAEQAQISQLKTQAQQAYNSRDYSSAINHITGYMLESGRDDEAQKFLGLCYIALQDYPKAINTLSAIDKFEEEYEDALWLKALSYLKLSEFVKLDAVLDTIIIEETPKSKQAQKIKSDLACLP